MTDKMDMRYDSRVIQHALRRQSLTHEEVRAHMASLPDDADEAEECEVTFSTPFADRQATREEE